MSRGLPPLGGGQAGALTLWWRGRSHVCLEGTHSPPSLRDCAALVAVVRGLRSCRPAARLSSPKSGRPVAPPPATLRRPCGPERPPRSLVPRDGGHRPEGPTESGRGREPTEASPPKRPSPNGASDTKRGGHPGRLAPVLHRLGEVRPAASGPNDLSARPAGPAPRA